MFNIDGERAKNDGNGTSSCLKLERLKVEFKRSATFIFTPSSLAATPSATFAYGSIYPFRINRAVVKTVGYSLVKFIGK